MGQQEKDQVFFVGCKFYGAAVGWKATESVPIPREAAGKKRVIQIKDVLWVACDTPARAGRFISPKRKLFGNAENHRLSQPSPAYL